MEDRQIRRDGQLELCYELTAYDVQRCLSSSAMDREINFRNNNGRSWRRTIWNVPRQGGRALVLFRV